LLTYLSRITSARVGSGIHSCHASTGIRVIIIDVHPQHRVVTKISENPSTEIYNDDEPIISLSENKLEISIAPRWIAALEKTQTLSTQFPDLNFL